MMQSLAQFRPEMLFEKQNIRKKESFIKQAMSMMK